MKANTFCSDNREVAPRKGRPPVNVDVSVVRALFGIPQPTAAKTLGISLTALKQVCRKMGVSRWPYRRGTGFDQLRSEPSSAFIGTERTGYCFDDVSIAPPSPAADEDFEKSDSDSGFNYDIRSAVLVEDEADDLDTIQLFAVGGEWADLYAKEATHLLDECIHKKDTKWTQSHMN